MLNLAASWHVSWYRVDDSERVIAEFRPAVVIVVQAEVDVEPHSFWTPKSRPRRAKAPSLPELEDEHDPEVDPVSDEGDEDSESDSWGRLVCLVC